MQSNLFTTAGKSEITNSSLAIHTCHLTREYPVPANLLAINRLEPPRLNHNLIKRALTHDWRWWHFTPHNGTTILFDVIVIETFILLFGSDQLVEGSPEQIAGTFSVGASVLLVKKRGFGQQEQRDGDLVSTAAFKKQLELPVEFLVGLLRLHGLQVAFSVESQKPHAYLVEQVDHFHVQIGDQVRDRVARALFLVLEHLLLQTFELLVLGFVGRCFRWQLVQAVLCIVAVVFVAKAALVGFGDGGAGLRNRAECLLQNNLGFEQVFVHIIRNHVKIVL